MLVQLFTTATVKTSNSTNLQFTVCQSVQWRAGVGGKGSIFDKGFLFSTASRPAVGPTHPPIQWIPAAISPEDKAAWTRRSALISIQCRGQQQWIYTFTVLYVFMTCCSFNYTQRKIRIFFTFAFFNINYRNKRNHHKKILSWTQFGVYEMLRAYLQDRKLSLSVDNDTLITNFDFCHNLLFLIQIIVVRKVYIFVSVSRLTTMSIFKLYSDEKGKYDIKDDLRKLCTKRGRYSYTYNSLVKNVAEDLLGNRGTDERITKQILEICIVQTGLIKQQRQQ